MKILILKLENKCFNIEETIQLKDNKKIYSENNKSSQDTKLNRCICRPNLQTGLQHPVLAIKRKTMLTVPLL